MSLTGLALAMGIAAGMVEPFGLAAAGTINAIAYSGWALWLLLLGILILRGAPDERSVPTMQVTPHKHP